MSDETPNIGQQFTDIIGRSLIEDSINNVRHMFEIAKPHADKIFKQDLSDRETLDHPAVMTHNALARSRMMFEVALEEHNKGNKVGAIHYGIQGHKNLLQALSAGLSVPHLRENGSEFIEHAHNITQNMTKLSNLYLNRGEND